MQRPADRAHTHAKHWGPSLTLTVFRCAGVGVLYNTPRDPRLSAGTSASESPILPSCPGALWKPEPPPLLLHRQWRSLQWSPWWPLHQNPISPLAIHQLGQLENLRLQGRDRESQEEKGNVCAASSCSLQGTCPLPQSPRPVSQDAQASQPRGNLPKVSPSGPLPQRT